MVRLRLEVRAGMFQDPQGPALQME
jgi:hypothetical protein